MFSSDFLPHGFCFQWQTGLLWLHVSSDALIGAAYFSIPFALLMLIRKRGDLQFDWILKLFALFILLCGTAHLLSIWTIWVPQYWFYGTVKAAAAAASITTAFLTWRLLPRLAALPSPQQLLSINQELSEVLERHRATERELRKLSLAVEHSSSMVVITDTNGLIEYCNPAFCQCTGYESGEAIGSKISMLGSGFTDQAVYRELWETISQGRPWQGELLDRKKNGDLYWSMLYIAPIRCDEPEITHFVAVSHDISDLKNSEETIRRLAFYDPLTELPNRALFKERLEQAQLHARRDGRKFALMYLDLDRFKHINDSLGHIVGDKLLIEVGQRLRGQLRGTDTVARMGGDEFAIILGDLSEAAFAAEISKCLCGAVNAPYNIDGHVLHISGSIGISIYPDDHKDIVELIRMADSALYKAKDMGRNGYAYFREELNPQGRERLALEADLRQAIERGELSVHYQPKVNLSDGRLIGAEALLRWRHPQHGAIAPERVLSIAEEIGLSMALGEWLLRTVCQQINTWNAAGFTGSVAVNLTSRQFREKTLLAMLDDILRETGTDAARMEFEVSETAAMDNPDYAMQVFDGLRERGSRVSIDDFGTGYSSLGYLKRFRVDALKIDRSFVHGLESEHEDNAVARAVIALARGLGLSVVAEGVETHAQMEFLRKEGCDRAQGYLFSPPVPVEIFEASLLGPSGWVESGLSGRRATGRAG